MKLVRVENLTPETPVWVIQLLKEERQCLLSILDVYPGLDLYLQPLSRRNAVSDDSQRLLHEAMAELRAARVLKLQQFVKGKSARIKRDFNGSYRLTLNTEDLEWLLQVLNEIRIGCWKRLGSLEMEDLAQRELAPEELRLRHLMDLCAYFQTELLEIAS